MPRVNPTLPADGESADASDISGPFLALLAIFNGNIGTDNLADGAVTAAKIGGDVSALGVPSGVYMPYGGVTAPSGWLMCDGSSYDRNTYANLFSVIGTAYGSSSGSTFNVPNLKSSFPAGLNSADAQFNAIGKVGGEAAHALTGDENGAHGHGVNDPGHAHGVGDPGHSHGVNDPFIQDVGSGGNLTQTGAGSVWRNLHSVNINASGTGIFIYGSGTGISIQGSGSGTPHNNLPPYVTSNFIIKT